MPVYLIFAIDNHFRIGKNGTLPWNLKEDIRYFQYLTKGNTIIMGRKTFSSLQNKPLSERKNIVFTMNNVLTEDEHAFAQTANVEYMQEKALEEYIKKNEKEKDIFLIGGNSVFQKFLHLAKYAHVTQIITNDKNETNEQTTYFTAQNEFSNYFQIIPDKCSPYFQKNDGLIKGYRFLFYENKEKINKEENKQGEEQYLTLLRNIYKKSENTNKRIDRTGVGIYSTFGKQLHFDMTNNKLPILTTKYVPWKTVLKELLWFFGGIPDVSLLEKENIFIWSANASRDFLDKRGLTQYKQGDIGPMYPFTLRHFGADYKGYEHDYKNEGIDQLENLVQNIKQDPFSRRHIITTYDPSIVDICALPPCHGLTIQFYVEDDKKGLSCHVYCRSSDIFLGLPFNITSYGFLTHIIAKKCDLEPNNLIMSLGDVHLYANHLEQAKEQLERQKQNKSWCFPALHLSDEIRNIPFENIHIDHFDIIGYFSHNTIKAPMAL